MIKISELQEYLKKYQERKKPRFENDTFKGFIGFIDQEQKRNSRVGVIPMEKREGMRRLKELNERQKEHQDSLVDPETDFNNLED